MVRKLATQVPAQVSRLLQADLIAPPAWYHASLAHPPPALPARQVLARSRPAASPATHADLPASASRAPPRRAGGAREPKPRVAAVVYDADRVRRQFFRDFPFEALRPVSLVEAANVQDEHAVRGEQWTSLEQRGAYPTVEDTVAFTLSLHAHHGASLTHAYAQATAEFVALRARHELATLAAEHEARHLGAEFGRDPFLEQRAIDSLAASSSSSSSAAAAAALSGTAPSTKHREPAPTEWTAAVPAARRPAPGFTRGAQYVAAWAAPPPLEPAEMGDAQGDIMSLLAGGTAQDGAGHGDDVDDLEILREANLVEPGFVPAGARA